LRYKHPGGLPFPDYVEFSSGADLLIHDAEYTPEEYSATRGWGHSSYNDALRLALEARVKQFGIFHHNPDRTDEAIDEIVHDCERTTDNWKSPLNIFAVNAGIEITL
jgi:ribonuclease BN (tRNA processing enzyme)